jgi:hypothetical protein
VASVLEAEVAMDREKGWRRRFGFRNRYDGWRRRGDLRDRRDRSNGRLAFTILHGGVETAARLDRHCMHRGLESVLVPYRTDWQVEVLHMVNRISVPEQHPVER